MMNHEIFYMLKGVLKESLSLDIQYVTDPTGDLTIIDHGLRRDVFGEEGYDNLKQILAGEVRVGAVIHLQDRFHMNYFLFPAHKKKRPYCSVGPFFTAEMSDADWNATFAQYTFTEQQKEVILRFVPNVPIISTPQAFSVAQNILLAAHGELDIFVRTVKLTPEVEPEVSFAKLSDFEEPRYSPDEIAHHENLVIQHVINGDYASAVKATFFFSSVKIFAPKGAVDSQAYLAQFHWINASYRKAVQDNGVPAYLVQSLYQQMYEESRNCTSYASYTTLQIRMLTAYCNLCKDFSTKDYSPVIRQIVNHIRMNLSQNLDIKTIAQNAGFSQTYITHKFKAEVGLSPGKFILEQRIRVAKKMLATSNKSVSEIASDVGIADWSYFSRLFKKSTGKSPSEFRKLYDKSDT